MRQIDLHHVIRAACDVLDADEVVVIGSQAILATRSEGELPAAATRSMEADIAATVDPDGTAAYLLSGVLGEDSAFNRTNGYFVDGVDVSTATLPTDWRTRAVRVTTYSVARGRDVVGICPDATDLCISKLAALRPKDLRFVAAVLDARVVDASLLLARLVETRPIMHPTAYERAADWVRGWSAREADDR